MSDEFGLCGIIYSDENPDSDGYEVGACKQFCNDGPDCNKVRLTSECAFNSFAGPRPTVHPRRRQRLSSRRQFRTRHYFFPRCTSSRDDFINSWHILQNYLYLISLLLGLFYEELSMCEAKTKRLFSISVFELIVEFFNKTIPVIIQNNDFFHEQENRV